MIKQQIVTAEFDHHCPHCDATLIVQAEQRGRAWRWRIQCDGCNTTWPWTASHNDAIRAMLLDEVEYLKAALVKARIDRGVLRDVNQQLIAARNKRQAIAND